MVESSKNALSIRSKEDNLEAISDSEYVGQPIMVNQLVHSKFGSTKRDENPLHVRTCS